MLPSLFTRRGARSFLPRRRRRRRRQRFVTQRLTCSTSPPPPSLLPPPLSFSLASLKGILITFFATEVTIRTGSGLCRGVGEVTRVRGWHRLLFVGPDGVLGTPLLPANLTISSSFSPHKSFFARLFPVQPITLLIRSLI